MAVRVLPRRTFLRGAGACLALPWLEAMVPARARAQEAATPRRFLGFFYPCGTDPSRWNPAPGALTADTLTPCLTDLSGFGAERIWPGASALHSEIAVITGIDHSGVCLDIHMPSLAFSAHKGTVNTYTPGGPTLDQYLAAQLAPETRFRNLALSATDNADIGQGSISFRAAGQPETSIRSPRQLFDMLFASASSTGAAERRSERERGLLSGVLEDARRLQARVGSADRQRLEQYFQAISELETQLGADSGGACATPDAPAPGGDWHTTTKQFIDLTVLAFACDLTRVATIQYSDSWGVHYRDYDIGSGMEALGSWSDHFISHKLGDQDRATDLDGLAYEDAARIANARVVLTSRFKVRRFAYLVEALKQVQTPFGTLLDETLALYGSENGDGDSHSRTEMPVLLAGHVGGFQTGRVIAAPGQPTGALHASILQQFGLEAASYGDPVGRPIRGF